MTYNTYLHTFDMYKVMFLLNEKYKLLKFDGAFLVKLADYMFL